MPVHVVKADAQCALAEIFEFNVTTYKICAAQWFAQLLGAGILLGSVALKLPQIFNIVWSGDVAGISPEAFYSEVPLCVHTIMYNYRKGYPFISYGETVSILVQNFILVLILWKYMKPSPSISHMAGVLALFAINIAVCFAISEDLLYLLPLVNFPLMIYARMVQIISSYRLRSTGQLSGITTFLNFMGNVARIFTTIQQVGWDVTLISGFAVATLLNGTQLFQIVYYSYLARKSREEIKEVKAM